MSEKIRWALIGIGRFSPQRGGVNAIAYAHAEALKRSNTEFELVAGASLGQENLDNFSREYPSRGYLDLYKLLKDEKPDGVTISTWAPSREEHVIAAIRAGVKYILVEKPLALSLKAIEHMKAEAEQYGTRLFVNFQRRYGAPFEWAREACLSGKIGKLSGVELRQPYSNLLDFGPHFVNAALFFTGEQNPLTVTAVADEEGRNPWHGMFVEKRMEAEVCFHDGLRFNISACPENGTELPAIRVNGDRGFVELYMDKQPGMKSVYRCLSDAGLENPESSENFHHSDEDHYLYFEKCYRDLAHAIRTGAPCRIDLEHGVRTQQILLAIYAAAQNHQRVSLADAPVEPVFRFA